MKLYIANPKPQNHDFMFRVGGMKVMKTIMIEAGSQVLLPLDMRTEDISAVVEANRDYGFVDLDELKRVRGHVSLIYSVDKPVPLTQLHHTFERNKTALKVVGDDIQKAAANSVAQKFETEARDRRLDNPLKSLQVELIPEKVGDVDEPFEGTDIRVVADEKQARQELADAGQGRRRGGRGR